ncbi:MAG: pyridoxal phosphate-dependent aminotransferase [Candidatus Levybacteria bacterium]|nr:pyridoxal phosphate-dependent aminotransferase [Candidatus Levybacteria bacterium]
MINGGCFSKKQLNYLGENSIRSVWDRIGKQKAYIADMSLGNPSGIFPPQKLQIQIKKLMQNSNNEIFLYMDNAGYLETRKAIARDLISSKFFSKELNENHIIMTAGASGAINCILSAILNPSDEVIIFSPFFVDYPKYVENFSATPKIVSLKMPFFDLDIELIEKAITKKTKAIIINSPNNPTGKVYSKEKLSELAKLLKKKNKKLGHPIYLISDEVYREIVYGGNNFFSPCTNYEFSIMAYSFSKSLSIPGERIGYAAIHPFMEEAETLFQLIKLSNRTLGFVNAPSLIQKIIPYMLPLKFNNKIYQKRKDRLTLSLTKAGFTFQPPEGAFYFFVKLPFGEEEFMKLATGNGLLVVNSKPFGISGYFRVAFCVPEQTFNLANKKFLKIGKIKRLSI